MEKKILQGKIGGKQCKFGQIFNATFTASGNLYGKNCDSSEIPYTV